MESLDFRNILANVSAYSGLEKLKCIGCDLPEIEVLSPHALIE